MPESAQEDKAMSTERPNTVARDSGITPLEQGAVDKAVLQAVFERGGSVDELLKPQEATLPPAHPELPISEDLRDLVNIHIPNPGPEGGIITINADGSERILPRISGGAAGWLEPNPATLAALSPDLRRRVSRLDRRPDELLDEQALNEGFNAIDELIADGKVPETEAQPYLDKITTEITERRRRAEEAKVRNGMPDCLDPADENDPQRKYIRGMLNNIEERGMALEQDPGGGYYTKLIDLVPHMHEDIRRETIARLNLHESFNLLSKISGNTETLVGNLRAAAQKLERENRLIMPDDLHLLLKEGLPGIQVRNCFDEMQTLTLTQLQSAAGRRELETKYGTEAHRLARRIGYVTFEEPVWDKEADANPLAEAIHLDTYRSKRYGQGRDRGPEKTLHKIDCVGTSFLRHWVLWQKEAKIQTDNAGNPLHYDYQPPVVQAYVRYERASKVEKSERLSVIHDMIYELRRGTHKTLRDGEGRPIPDAHGNRQHETYPARDPQTGRPHPKAGQPKLVLDFDEMILSSRELAPRDVAVGRKIDIDRTSYYVYLFAPLPRMLSVKELLLKEEWKPEEITRTALEKWVYDFNSAADPGGFLHAKPVFLVGVFDEGLKRGARTGWGRFETADIEKELLEDLGTEEGSGRLVSFVKPEQMSWVMKETNAVWRSHINDFQLTLRGAQRLRQSPRIR